MPRKTLKQREKTNTDTDDSINRLRDITNNLVGTEDPDDLMLEIISALTETKKVPKTGKYYITLVIKVNMLSHIAPVLYYLYEKYR